MRKVTKSVIAGFAVAALAVPSLASAGGSPIKPERAPDVWIGGSISALGANSLTVRVEKSGPRGEALRGKQVTVALEPETKIMLEGKPASFAELKVGDRVGLQADASGPDLTQGLSADRIVAYPAEASSHSS
jgi:hypothetical protein